MPWLLSMVWLWLDEGIYWYCMPGIDVVCLLLCFAFTLVLYTPARMFFNCTRILWLHQDCMRIVNCEWCCISSSCRIEMGMGMHPEFTGIAVEWTYGLWWQICTIGTVYLLHRRWMTEFRTVPGYCIVEWWLSDAILESQCNGRTDGPTTPSWFYILRPACSPIAIGFHDCTRIAWGLRIVLGFWRGKWSVWCLVPIIFLPILPLGLCYDSKVAWGFRVAVKIGCIALGLCKTV